MASHARGATGSGLSRRANRARRTGFSFAQLPPTAKIVFLNSWLQPENGHADVFLPISVMTERAGHYTNFDGTVSPFEVCFAKPPGVIDAELLFANLGSTS